MNVLNRLTVRQLKLNRRRTLITLLGVIISVAMITAVASLGTSFVDFLQRGTKAESGNWHVLYKAVSPEQAKGIQADKHTDIASFSQDIGYAKLAGSQNVDRPYLFLRGYDRNGYENFPIKLKEGRLPATPEELVISEAIEPSSGVKFSIGDKLTLEVGDRILEQATGELPAGSRLTQNTPLQWNEKSEPNETFKPISSRSYTVVGVIERPPWEPANSPGYTAMSYLDIAKLKPGETVNASVAVKKVTKSIFTHAENLSKELGITEKIQYNTDLLRYYGVMKEDNLRKTLYSILGIIMVIILVGSVSLIYNAFAISVSERSRQLGMLSSVGATRKQKKRSVFFEGGVIGLISIPIGLAAGLAGMGITLRLLQPLIRAGMGVPVDLELVVSPLTLLLAAAISIVTILISTYNPARRASRISAMDAIRQSQDVRLTGKAVKTSRLTRKVFGFEAEIALKNLKRNKRRYRATVFSLIVSLVLFLTVSTFTFYLHKSVEISQSNYNFDIQIHRANENAYGGLYTEGLKPEETLGLFNQIAAMDKVKESAVTYRLDAGTLVAPGQATERAKQDLANSGETAPTGKFPYYVQIISLNDEAFRRYANEVGVNPEALMNAKSPSAIVVDTATYRQQKDGKFVKVKTIQLKEGDTLPLTVEVGDPLKKEPVGTLTAVRLTDKLPLGVTQYEEPRTVFAVLPLSAFKAMEKAAYGPDSVQPTLSLKSDDPIGLQTDIEKWKSAESRTDIYTWNVYKSRQSDRQMMQIINVFAYGFVSLITAISTANIFNTISTSIALRKREFAMLRSVGMTPKSFNKMIRFESLFYGIKTLLYGLPISFVVMLLLFKSLSGTFSFVFSIPWTSVLIGIGAVFVIVGASMLYSGSKVRKENILDGLRTENI
ncbi:ABC transporter permease [Gorillibacterium sp. sgz500922]|uniref:ABC transporter permease n=1 Tax=Gorillibacterium sp. sgz500922 TaxID=3446694 RepID=UPI003F67E8FB